MKECLKCGHTNPAEAIEPADSCPNCGAVYAKVELAIQKARQSAEGKKQVEAAQRQRDKQEAARLAKEKREAHHAQQEAARQERIERRRERAGDFQDENIEFAFQSPAATGIIGIIRVLLYFVFVVILLTSTLFGYGIAGFTGLMVGTVIGAITGAMFTGFGFLVLNINDRLNNIQIILAAQMTADPEHSE